MYPTAHGVQILFNSYVPAAQFSQAFLSGLGALPASQDTQEP